MLNTHLLVILEWCYGCRSKRRKYMNWLYGVMMKRKWRWSVGWASKMEGGCCVVVKGEDGDKKGGCIGLTMVACVVVSDIGGFGWCRWRWRKRLVRRRRDKVCMVVSGCCYNVLCKKCRGKVLLFMKWMRRMKYMKQKEKVMMVMYRFFLWRREGKSGVWENEEEMGDCYFFSKTHFFPFFFFPSVFLFLSLFMRIKSFLLLIYKS